MFRVSVQAQRITVWIICGLIGTGVVWASPESEEFDAIRQEFQNRRLLECRFPGRGWHEPFDSEGRGRLVDLSDDLATQAHLIVEVEQRAETPDPAALRELVYLHLLTGRLGQAVAEAQRWVAQFPTPEAWNGLACAWYEQGVQTGQRERLLDALWALDQVPAEESSSRQTLFNRALVVSSLPLPELTRTSWQELRALETDSGWRAEIEGRLSRTERPSVHEQWETDQDWVLAAVTGSDEVLAESTTVRFLRLLEKYVEKRLSEVEVTDGQLYHLANRLAEASGDMLLLNALQAWKDASQDRREDLLLGHQRYVEATRLQDESKVDQAFQAFQTAADALRRGDSPLYSRAVYATARAEFYLGRLDAASTRLQGLYEEPGIAKNYPRIQAQVAWLLALIHGGQGRLDDQVAAFLKARSLFVETRDAYGVASIDVLLAGVAHRQGRHTEAWNGFLQAGSYLVDHGEARRLHVMWHELSESLLQIGRPTEARYFIDELLHNAQAWGHPAAQAEAWRLAAKIADAEGRSHDAQDALERAHTYALSFDFSGFPDRIEAALRVVEGEILVDSEPRRAIKQLGTALETYHQMGYRYYLPRLLSARARAHANLGDARKAAVDFDGAVEELETLLAGTGEDEDRVSLLRTSQRVFEAAARFHLDIGDAKTALAYVERGRRLGPNHMKLSRIDEIPSPGPDEAYMVYALLADRLVIFVWRRDGLRVLETGTRTGEIEACLTSLRTAVARREPLAALEPLLEQLYEWLIAPALPLADVQRLVLIPEGRLSETPFPLLRGQGQEVRLVERFVLAAAPSLAFLGDENGSTPTPEVSSKTALTVVNPRIDRETYPALPDLSWAQDELSTPLEDIAEGSVLHGEHATRDAVMEGMLRADRVWISAHLEADPANPFESVLVVAPDNSTGSSQGPGILGAEDVRRLALEHLDWVVLATCQGAQVFRQGREAVAGLSRAFLQAGSPFVIASIWSLDDEDSLDFTRRLRRELDRERDPVVALTKAQVEALRSTNANTDDYVTWAGFRVMGRVHQH